MVQQSVSPERQSALRVRAWSLAGALLIFTVVWLGLIWPSVFTFVALCIAPALVLFAIGTVSPAFYGQKKGLRLYLRVSLVLAAASWLLEIGWLWFTPG